MRAGSVRVSDWIEGLERWPAPRIAAVVIVLVGAPLALAVAPFTAAAADFGLVVLALAAAGGGAGLWRRKQLKAALPLELSRVGLAGHVNGAPVVDWPMVFLVPAVLTLLSAIAFGVTFKEPKGDSGETGGKLPAH